MFLQCYKIVCADENRYRYSPISPTPIGEPHRTYFELTTNSMEGIANANIHSGARNCSPPESIPIILQLYCKQMNQLSENIKARPQAQHQHLTGIGQNIFERLISDNDTGPDRILQVNHGKLVKLTSKDEKRFGSGGNDRDLTKMKIELSSGNQPSWLLEIVFPFEDEPKYWLLCTKHMKLTSQIRCPCQCIKHVYKESKKIQEFQIYFLILMEGKSLISFYKCTSWNLLSVLPENRLT